MSEKTEEKKTELTEERLLGKDDDGDTLSESSSESNFVEFWLSDEKSLLDRPGYRDSQQARNDLAILFSNKEWLRNPHGDGGDFKGRFVVPALCVGDLRYEINSYGGSQPVEAEVLADELKYLVDCGFAWIKQKKMEDEIHREMEKEHLINILGKRHKTE